MNAAKHLLVPFVGLLLLAGCKEPAEGEAAKATPSAGKPDLAAQRAKIREREAHMAPKPTANPMFAGITPGCPHCKCKGDAKIDLSRGVPQRCDLEQDTEIQGITVAAGRVRFTREGWLRRFKLAVDKTLGGVPCLAGSTVDMVNPKQLRRCETKEAVTIDGFSCSGRVALHAKGGKLSDCTFTKDTTVGGLTVPAGTRALLTRGGKFDRLDLRAPLEIDGKSCDGEGNYLHRSGKLKRCVLAKPTTIDEQEYEEGKAVCFDQRGKVRGCKGMRLRQNG